MIRNEESIPSQPEHDLLLTYVAVIYMIDTRMNKEESHVSNSIPGILYMHITMGVYMWTLSGAPLSISTHTAVYTLKAYSYIALPVLLAAPTHSSKNH